MKKILYTANTYRHLYLCHLPYIKYLSSNYILDTASNNNKKVEEVRNAYNIPIERKPFKINNIKSIFILKKIIEEEKYDLIHTNTPMGSVVTRLAALKYKKRSNLKIIYTAHGFHFFKGCPIINYLIYYPIEKILSRCTDIIITMNKEDYNFARKHFKTKIEYIPGIGFNKDKFDKKITNKEIEKFKEKNNINDNDYVISYIAEISKRKRQEYLIKDLINKKLKSINYYWTTSLIKDILVKGVSIAITTAGLIYIVVQGCNDYNLLLLAAVNLVMFICFGLLALNNAYEFYNNRHVPYMIDKINKRVSKEDINKCLQSMESNIEILKNK